MSPKRAWRHKVSLKCIQNPFLVPSSIRYKHVCIQTWIHTNLSPRFCHHIWYNDYIDQIQLSNARTFLRCSIDICMFKQASMLSISFQVKLLLKIEINKNKLDKSSYVCNLSIIIRILDTYNVTPMLETKRERVSPNALCFGDSLDHFLVFFVSKTGGIWRHFVSRFWRRDTLKTL